MFTKSRKLPRHFLTFYGIQAEQQPSLTVQALQGNGLCHDVDARQLATIPTLSFDAMTLWYVTGRPHPSPDPDVEPTPTCNHTLGQL